MTWSFTPFRAIVLLREQRTPAVLLPTETIHNRQTLPQIMNSSRKTLLLASAFLMGLGALGTVSARTVVYSRPHRDVVVVRPAPVYAPYRHRVSIRPGVVYEHHPYRYGVRRTEVVRHR